MPAVRQSLSPAEIVEYHLRASRWYEKNGDGSEAFQHAFAAGDFGRAAGWLRRLIREWIIVSRLPLVRLGQ